jgi:hypothetical protein
MPLAASRLNQLAAELANDVIVVRNNQAGITVFTDDSTKITYVWEGKGDGGGRDVCEVSSQVLRNPDFRRALLRDLLTVEDAPEALAEALGLQQKEWEARQNRLAESQATLDRAADRTIARGVACIAPKGSSRSGELCGSYALASGQNPNERPPLCSEHVHLGVQYIPHETGKVLPNGKSEIVWRRAGIANA